jgi:hypothetical protein
MNEQTPQPEEKKFPEAFTADLASRGVKATILEDGTDEKGNRKLAYWNLKKGATDIAPVTPDNLVDWRPLTREERRAVFHTPYKHNRRHALNPNRRARV